MQAHFYEWYQITNLHLDEEMFQKKKKVVDTLKGELLKPDNEDLLFDCVMTACCEIKIINPESKYITEAINTFKSFQITFPINISENSLELKVASGIILEDLLTEKDSDVVGDSLKTKISLFILSSLGLIKITELGKYLEDRIKNLRDLAESHIELKARELRHREPIDFSIIDDSKLPADQDAWDKFRSEISDVLYEIEQQTKADREEIELLWWFQNGESLLSNELLSSISIESIPIIAGLEVAELTIYPPLKSSLRIIEKAISKDRNDKKLLGKEFKDFVIKKANDQWIQLSIQDEEIRRIIIKYPSIFPLSWLGMRIKENKGITPGLMDEFETRTGILQSSIVTPVEIGHQVFREKLSTKAITEE